MSKSTKITFRLSSIAPVMTFQTCVERKSRCSVFSIDYLQGYSNPLAEQSADYGVQTLDELNDLIGVLLAIAKNKPGMYPLFGLEHHYVEIRSTTESELNGTIFTSPFINPGERRIGQSLSNRKQDNVSDACLAVIGMITKMWENEEIPDAAIFQAKMEAYTSHAPTFEVVTNY